MGDTGILRREQSNDKIDRHAIGRREIDSLIEPHQHRDRAIDAIHTRVGNCYPPSEAGAAQLLTLIEALKHGRTIKPIDPLETFGEPRKYFLLGVRAQNRDGIGSK